MSVSAIGANYAVQENSAIKATENTSAAAKTEETSSSGSASSKQDTIEISEEGKSKLFNSNGKGFSSDVIDAIKESQNASFKNMLNQMLGNQGSVYNFALNTNSSGIDFEFSGKTDLSEMSELFNEDGGIDISKLKEVMESGQASQSSGGILDDRYMPDFSEWTTASDIAKKYMQNKAAASTSENGYWGSEAVSDRIMNMVKSISGGNSEMFSTLKDAVLEGFEQAKSSWGGELDITSKTYDALISKMDAYASGLKPSTGTDAVDGDKSESAGAVNTENSAVEDKEAGTAEKIEENSGLTGDLGLSEDDE